MKADFSKRTLQLAAIWGVEPYEEFKFEGIDKRFRVTEHGFEMYSEFVGKWFSENIPAWALQCT